MEGPYLRMKELAPYLNLSPATLFDWLDPNSPRYDDTFPASVQLGQRAVGWSKAEIDEWCSKKQFARSSGKTRQVKTKKARKPPAPSSMKQATDLAHPALTSWDRVEKSRRRDHYLRYILREPSWTPVMAALLASGFEAPLGCTEVPELSKMLYSEINAPNAHRQISVAAILREWIDHIQDLEETNQAPPNGNPLSIVRNPIDFLNWFDDERIDTPWIRLIRRLEGCPMQDDPQSVNLLILDESSIFENRDAESNLDNRSSQAITVKHTNVIDGGSTPKGLETQGIQNFHAKEALSSNANEVSETPKARRQRLATRLKELKRKGARNFNQILAKEEHLSIPRIKQLLEKPVVVQEPLRSTLKQIVAAKQK